MMEQRVYERLTTDPDTNTIFGDRVYPAVMPQGVTYPAIAYTRISTTPNAVITGRASSDRTEMQVDVYAKSVLKAYEGSRAVQTSLETAEPPIMMRGLLYGYESETQLHRFTLTFSGAESYN